MSLKINGIVFYTTQEVLKKCKVSRQTIWRWKKEGKVPKGRKFRDGKLLFTESELRSIYDFANSLIPHEISDEKQLKLF